MVNGDSEKIDLLKLSKKGLSDLLRKIEERKGLASTEATKIRGFIQIAQGRTRERLPQRRFGFSVSKIKQAQTSVFTRRKEAKTFIVDARKTVSSLERSQVELEQERKLVRDVKKARTVFESTDPRAIFGLKGKRQARFFSALKSKRRSQLQRVEIRSLEKRGILEKKGNEFVFTEEGIEKIQAGKVDFSKFKFVEPPTIVSIKTESPDIISIKATDFERKPKKKTFIVKGIERFKKAETFVAKFTTKKVIPKGTAKKISKFIGSAGFIVPSKVVGRKGQIIEIESPAAKFAGGIASGVVTTIREKPLTTVLTFGVGKVVGVGLTVAGAGVTRTGALFGVKGVKVARRITTSVGIGVGVGAGALILRDIEKNVLKEASAEGKGEVIAKTGISLFAFGAGAKSGTVLGKKLVGRLQTIKSIELPQSEKVFDPLVVSGKKRFPEIPSGETPKQLRQRFLEPKLPGELAGIPRAFTAIDVSSKDLIVKATIGQPKGKSIRSEMPGQFAADVISTNFLRLGKTARSTSGGKLSFQDFIRSFDIAPSEPVVIRSTLKAIKIPKSVGSSIGFSKKISKELSLMLGGKKGTPMAEIIASKPTLKPGEAVLPFFKPEREVIIVKDSPFKITGKRFFVKVEGIRVPIIERTFIPSNIVSPKKSLIQEVKTRFKDIPITIFESGGGSIGSPKASILSQPLISFKSKTLSPGKPLSSSSLVKSSSRGLLSSGRTSSIGSSRSLSIPKSSLSFSISSGRSGISRSSKLTSSPISSPRISPSKASVSISKISSLRLSSPSKTPRKRTRVLLPRFKISGRTTQKKRKLRFDDDLAIIPDITSRVAGLTVKIPREKLRGVASKRLSGLGLRKVPLIIR